VLYVFNQTDARVTTRKSNSRMRGKAQARPWRVGEYYEVRRLDGRGCCWEVSFKGEIMNEALARECKVKARKCKSGWRAGWRKCPIGDAYRDWTGGKRTHKT
jgi:hypothetical protein